MNKKYLTHLKQLEAESIYIFREVISEFNNPVMMYSVGKDSSVMLHLARKSFFPGKIPFPILHIDTGWKFLEMYKFRDYISKKYKLNLLIYKNKEGEKLKINPFSYSSNKYTNIMKTEGLKKALNKYKFDAIFGGARRDEEKSRSKERIYSFRDVNHRWDPKNQRPELWNNYNGQINKKESIRIFPLSNWTELDIWLYIFFENIEIVSLYFSKIRPIINKNNLLMMIDNKKKINFKKNEIIKNIEIRFRTLGCWPLTGALISKAKTLIEIIEEMLISNNSERKDRLIDHDQSASMEIKKKEGYF